MSSILERLGVSANRPVPREIVPVSLKLDRDGNATAVTADDATLAKIITGLQLDIFKVAQALSQFAVTMGTSAERSDAEGSGELYIDQEENLIYYDPPAKANDPAPSHAWVPLAYLTSLAWRIWKTGEQSVSGYNVLYIHDLTTLPASMVVPSAVGHAGERVAYKKVDTSSNALTLNFTGGETGDGYTSYVITRHNSSRTFVSDGVNWVII